MKKELPKVYANKIDKEIRNNVSVSYNKDDNFLRSDNEMVTKNEKNNINQKINNIFNADNYIYKADVIITLKDKSITKRIIGKNSTHLITYDNELIALTDIIDIRYK